jgi:predicted ATP-grasp superfamily ATP-dependent carboligase
MIDRSRSSDRSILLVGATVRAAAESARRAGYCPIAVDLYGDRETRVAAERWHSLADFREAVETQGRIADGHGNCPVAIVGGIDGGYDWLRNVPNPFRGAAPQMFAQSDGPEFLCNLADHASVAFPEFRCSGPAREGWLIKRRFGSGGMGVQYCRDRNPIADDCYIQEPVRGRVFGASYLGDGRQAILLGVCRLLKKRIVPLPFVFAGAIGPIKLTQPLVQAFKRLGDAYLAAVPMVGPFNIDVVVEGTSVTLLEVNPRWSGSMEILERAWSERLDRPCSFFEDPSQWERWTEQDRLDRAQSFAAPHTYLKRIVFARRERVVCPADFERCVGKGRWIWKDVPSSATRIRRREPIATLIARTDRLSLPAAFRVGV